MDIAKLLVPVDECGTFDPKHRQIVNVSFHRASSLHSRLTAALRGRVASFSGQNRHVCGMKLKIRTQKCLDMKLHHVEYRRYALAQLVITGAATLQTASRHLLEVT
jgi:hypothetical protein